jgi:hypothetical protein
LLLSFELRCLAVRLLTKKVVGVFVRFFVPFQWTKHSDPSVMIIAAAGNNWVDGVQSPPVFRIRYATYNTFGPILRGYVSPGENVFWLFIFALGRGKKTKQFALDAAFKSVSTPLLTLRTRRLISGRRSLPIECV